MDTNRWTTEQQEELRKRMANRPVPPPVQGKTTDYKRQTAEIKYNPLGKNTSYTAYKSKCGTCGK